MSVAIIGGTGFMGSAVVDTLPLRGLAPIVIARDQRPKSIAPDAIFEPADRIDAKALTDIFRRHDVDSVVDIFALGLLNTSAVFEIMGPVGSRYLLLSSIDVYSNYGRLLRREEPQIQPEPTRTPPQQPHLPILMHHLIRHTPLWSSALIHDSLLQLCTVKEIHKGLYPHAALC